MRERLQLKSLFKKRGAAPDADASESAPMDGEPKPALRPALITFAVGIALLALIGALVLTQAPPRLARLGTPGVRAIGPEGAKVIGSTQGSLSVCQPGEVLPAGTSAIRVAIWGFFGARIHLAVFEGSQVLTQGSRSANWTGDTVTIPVRPLARTHGGVSVCYAIGPNSETQLLLGARVPHAKHPVIVVEGSTDLSNVTAATNKKQIGAKLTIEYLAPGRTSWWSQLLTVARHMGLGRAYSGTWIALLVALMMAAVGVLSVRLAIRELQ